MTDVTGGAKSVAIARMDPGHWPEVRAIYAEGIGTGNATFETTVPEWSAWHESHAPDCRFVACEGETVVGWAALSPVSRRSVYRGVAEVSVYVAAVARGLGVGAALLRALVTASEEAGYWTLQASVFPENEATLRLHSRCGFRVVGRRERIGCGQGRWRDTLLLERRSTIAGLAVSEPRSSEGSSVGDRG